jgi:hypothetical protein
VIVLGEVTGNVTASDKVEIRTRDRSATISSPRVAIAEGAHFRGSVDVQRKDRGGAETGCRGSSCSARGRRPAMQRAERSGAHRPLDATLHMTLTLRELLDRLAPRSRESDPPSLRRRRTPSLCVQPRRSASA